MCHHQHHAGNSVIIVIHIWNSPYLKYKKEKCTLLVSPTNVAFNDKLAFLVSSKPLFFCTLKCHFFFIDSFTVKIRAILRQNSASSQLLAFYCTDSKQNIQSTFSTHYYCFTDYLRGLKLESMRGQHFEKRVRSGQHMEIKCLRQYSRY